MSQGSLPICPAVTLIGRGSHPLDGYSAFLEHSPFSRTSLSWSHGVLALDQIRESIELFRGWR
jgi:hypothetical protein